MLTQLALIAFQFDWTITVGNLITIVSVFAGAISIFWKQRFFNENQIKINQGQERINTKLEAGIEQSKNISHGNAQQILALRESHIELKADVKHTKSNVDEVKETINHMSDKIDTIKSFRT